MPRISARRLAGLSALFNLPFVLLQAQRTSYDANSHIFLADHYRRSWFSLWEPRWYLGFSVASYPPLVHQLIALISWPARWVIAFFAPGPESYPGAFTWVAEETGYVLLLIAVVMLLPLALHAFARLFVGPGAADTAALLAVFLPALSLTAWSFGQLPTLLATGAVLLALVRGAEFVRAGRRLYLLQAVALAAVAGAAHHGVFLLVPFAGAAVAWRALAASPPAAARSGRWRVTALRLLKWAVLSAAAVALVLWPFLLWSRGQQMQTPIDHASRHSLLADSLARWYFFWLMYGPLLLVLPWAAWAGTRRRLLPLLVLVLVLFLLGLGGTTPLPRVLFGAGWAWLTYDRFAFWSALLLLPFAGLALVRLRKSASRVGRLLAIAFLASMFVVAEAAGWLAVLSHAQPPAADVGAIVGFLNQPDHQLYRYFTLGFGDQMAKIAALTQNGTPDGDYHTARSLPELRSSGLGTVDGAVWNPLGVVAARPLLAGAARYGARWAFVNHPSYVPILLDTGWQFFAQREAIQIWEQPNVSAVAALPPSVAGGALAAAWWGVAPLAALLLAVAALAHERIWRVPALADVTAGLRWLRRAGWVVAMALLALWWMHVLRGGATAGAYFSYDSVILYAADCVCAATLALWLLERALRRERLRFGPPLVAGVGLVLIGASAVSVVTSGDRALSSAVAAHLLLVAAWYWLIVNDPPSAAMAGLVLGWWLVGEALAALIEVALQNTLWLHGLFLPWPGLMTAPMPGASVVQNAAGIRWLRTYGTLPHPNILGGFLLIGLAAVVERYVATGRRMWLAAAAVGTIALVSTFSRASWLAAGLMVGGGAYWFWCYAREQWRRYRSALLAMGLAATAALLPLLPLLAVRVDFSDQAVSTETRSLQERQLYALASLHMLAAQPISGIGAGTFVEVLSGLVPPLTRLEPVHNVILLIAAETGLLGGLAVVTLVVVIAWIAWRRRRVASAAEAMWALVLLGMFVTGLFDHYWWTAPPARLGLATVLGLWAASLGHVSADDEVTLDARREALRRLEPYAHEVRADSRV